MGKAVVDAGVLIAWAEPEDVFHSQAIEMLAKYEELVVHVVNYAELLVGLEESEWAKFAEQLQTIGCVPTPTTPEALASARKHTGLKLPDACVIALAQTVSAEAILTLDKRVAKAAKSSGFTVG
ncbi:MAG: PIN domain-containing protein [Propionibacteriaceae bacterium]|jgi:predicted nucleic acid-binding protein|nr:PIN domain-containing protein [Propionibacteriaceae bacterium]